MIARSTDILKAVAHLSALNFGKPSEWMPCASDLVTLCAATEEKGPRFRVIVETDNDSDPFQDTEYLGKVCWPGSDRKRPAVFNGAARKLTTRHGPIWWQPPTDMTDPQALKAVQERAAGWFLEHWSYVGVVVEVESAPCPHCGERKKLNDQSLWSIETDAGDYFGEVLTNLLAEV